jgi:ElaB/YqjD/DUF883 family membrane-anchored ribosome-binding protein
METPATTGEQGASAQAGIMSRLKETTTAQLSRQKERATDGLGSVAQAVRQSTQPLREQKYDTLARYIEQGADQLEKLSRQIKEKNVEQIVEDAQRFARQRPALFIGAAFALGVVGARFLKSSADRNRNAAAERYADGSGEGMTNLRRTSVAPTNAIETMKETAKWTTKQRA